MAATGTGSLVFIDDATGDRKRMINSQVCRALCLDSAESYKTD